MVVYDAVVVGSGFGASVSAFRLAEAGRSVLVLERGRKYPPGSFARSPSQMSTNLWDPSEGLHGLFDIWSFRGLDAIVSSGVGGGSLIYANVMIRKEDDFQSWPVTRAMLDPEYDKVEKVLRPERYPIGKHGFGDVPKAEALKTAARRLGLAWEHPDLAVSFGDGPGMPIREKIPNIHQSPRQTCRLVGECDIGCNYGSKNSLDMNYLPLAEHYEAEISELSEVKSLERALDGTWTVGFVRRYPENLGKVGITRRPEPLSVRARIVVVGAGALGSTYLLLNNRANLPRISPRLGRQFSTNGDYLAFLRSKNVGYEPSQGPVITTAMRVPDSGDDSGRGFYVEDGGYPVILDWLIEYAVPVEPAVRAGRILATRLWQRLLRKPEPATISNQVSALLGSGARSAGILPLLAMGRDVAGGEMRLSSGLLDVDWDVSASRAYYQRVRDTLEDMADVLDAKYLDSVSYALSRAITVHPVGGCAMGSNREEGVVDDHGEVFGYQGLFVADGSVMPGPVGPNPSFTIAALAERFSGRMIERLDCYDQ